MNINKYFDLSHMTEGERYWFGYLNRMAETNGWSTPDDQPLTSSVFLTLETLEDDQVTQQQACLADLLMVGLHTQDTLLALRCFGDANRKVGELAGNRPTYHFADALGTFRRKMERMVSQ